MIRAGLDPKKLDSKVPRFGTEFPSPDNFFDEFCALQQTSVKVLKLNDWQFCIITQYENNVIF